MATTSERAVTVACPACQAKFRTKAKNVGKRTKCLKCGMVLVISPPKEAKQAEPAPSSMEQFLDEELSTYRIAAPAALESGTSPGTSHCCYCGSLIGEGAVICIVCGIDLRTGRRIGALRDVTVDASEDETLVDRGKGAGKKRKRARGRRSWGWMSDSLSEWMAKASTVLFIGGILWFVATRFVNFVSDLEIENVLTANEVSDGIEQANSARWLDLNLNRMPKYVDKFQGESRVDNGTADGMWSFALKTQNGQVMVFSKASLVLENGKPVRKELGLKHTLHNTLMQMGYFQEKWKRPAPIRLAEFSIKDPMGRTWTVQGESSAAQQMANLAVMIGFMPQNVDFSPLLKAPRESLSYAVFFSALNESMPLEWKIQKSCDPDRRIRACAAEMLVSTLPCLPVEGRSVASPDKSRYDALVAQLAQATSTAEKKRIYEQLRDQMLSQ